MCPSISTAPLKSAAPVNVDAPPTRISVEISTWALISTLDTNVEKPAIFTLSSSVWPSTSRSPLASRVPIIVVTPVTWTPPPTKRFLSTPTPPANLAAPVTEFEDCVVLLASRTPVIVVSPVTSAPPPTKRFFSIPTPPSMTNAPVSLLEDWTVLSIVLIELVPLTSSVPIVAIPIISKLVSRITSSLI